MGVAMVGGDRAGLMEPIGSRSECAASGPWRDWLNPYRAEKQVRPTPAYVAGADFVEMAVRPAHGDLQTKVKAVQADRQRYLDPTHDGRFDIVEVDPEMGDASSE